MDSIVLLAWAERNRSFRKPILWRRSGETGTTAPELIVISSVERVRGARPGEGRGWELHLALFVDTPTQSSVEAQHRPDSRRGVCVCDALSGVNAEVVSQAGRLSGRRSIGFKLRSRRITLSDV